MEKYKVYQYFNEDEFNKRTNLSTNEKSRFFTVKLLKDRVSGKYEGSTYFEISGEITDAEIKSEISSFLDPKYRNTGLFQIFEK